MLLDDASWTICLQVDIIFVPSVYMFLLKPFHPRDSSQSFPLASSIHVIYGSPLSYWRVASISTSPGFRVPPHKMRHRHANISTARSCRAIAPHLANQERRASLHAAFASAYCVLIVAAPMSHRFVPKICRHRHLSVLNRCLLAQSPAAPEPTTNITGRPTAVLDRCGVYYSTFSLILLAL